MLFLQIAISEAEHGNTVWYLASKPVDKLPETFFRKDRFILKRIIFTYCKSLETLIQKLLDLDNMFITPSLIITESLHSFFANSPKRNAEHFLQGHAKTLATLQSCVYSFNERLKGPCWSIVSLDDNEGYSQQCIATLIDLFYYKANYVRAVDSTFVQWLEEFKFKFVK